LIAYSGTSMNELSERKKAADVFPYSCAGGVWQPRQTGVFKPSVGNAHPGADLAGELHLVFPHVLKMPGALPPRFIAQCGQVAHRLLCVNRFVACSLPRLAVFMVR